MASGDGLARLLHLRLLEEDQRRAALDAATAELLRLRSILRAAEFRRRQGRELIARSSHSESPADRIAGMVESQAAGRTIAVVRQRIATVELHAAELRRAYLEKRTERRQVETLLSEAAAREAREQGRREQQGIDNWFGVVCHARTTGPSSRTVRRELEMKKNQQSDAVSETERESNL